MPRSLGFWAAPTYEKMLTQMIPNIRKGLGMYGMIEDVHYSIGKFLPKGWDRPKPFTYPDKPNNFIHFFNGSGISLVSLDRTSTMGNGLDTDWGMVDEAKLCEKDKLDEVFLTMRGNKHYFEGKSEHYGLLIASDKPRSGKGKWLLDFKSQMNPKIIDNILDCSLHLADMMERVENVKHPNSVKRLMIQIRKFERYRNELRKKSVYVSEASTLDNICNIGIDPIMAFKMLLTDDDFKRSVLNQDIFAAKNGFYELLDEEMHGYDSPNYSFVDGQSLSNPDQRDCRWDSDLNQTQPLHIGCDYNNKINWAVIGQMKGTSPVQLASFYVKKPLFLRDLAAKVAAYYRFKSNKTYYYHFDQTADKVDAVGNVPFSDVFISEMTKHGWKCIPVRFSQPGFKTRYKLWQEILTGDNERNIVFSYNRTNNKDWYISMKAAEVKEGKTGFEKDKKSETDGVTPPELATHASEATDTLIYGMMKKFFNKYSDESLDVGVR